MIRVDLNYYKYMGCCLFSPHHLSPPVLSQYLSKIFFFSIVWCLHSCFAFLFFFFFSKFLHLQWKCQKLKAEMKSRSRRFMPSANNRMRCNQERQWEWLWRPSKSSQVQNTLHEIASFFRSACEALTSAYFDFFLCLWIYFKVASVIILEEECYRVCLRWWLEVLTEIRGSVKIEMGVKCSLQQVRGARNLESQVT